MKPVLLTLAVIAGLALLMFGLSRTGTSTSEKTTFAQIQADMQAGSQLIDVRTAEEYASGHIKDAMNYDNQLIQSGSLPKLDKSKTHYVYCRSGNRSAQATEKLEAAGYVIKDLGAISSVKSLGGLVVK